MYATGYATRTLRAPRPRPAQLRWTVALAVALAAAGWLALGAHGGAPRGDTRVVVQAGDTLWSIAAQRYPGDDVRSRVEDIERANGLASPVIEVGQTLRLPG